MALATFNGYTFTDLSGDVPNQWDAILFANAWNGHYWLVGGVGFLAKYDGLNFTDLTPCLNAALGRRHALDFTSCCNAVNAIAWDGVSWRLGGGAPVATAEPLTAWAASYDGEGFTDLTSFIPSYIADAARGSSILSISSSDGSWFFGGYVNGGGLLFTLANSVVTDFSEMINGSMTTVNWVGAWPETVHGTLSNPVAALGNYVLVPIMIVLIGSALAIKYRKRNH